MYCDKINHSPPPYHYGGEEGSGFLLCYFDSITTIIPEYAVEPVYPHLDGNRMDDPLPMRQYP